MADITVKVLTPADSYALLTLDELKKAFGITDSALDEQLQMLIDGYSDVVATMCNRCFAKEQVEETWRGDPPPYENYRIFLTHYPVADADIESVAVNGSLITDYELENASGKLSLGAWADPIIVTYSGGYALPDEAPPALKQAMMLLVQAGRSQIVRGMNMSGIRSISHKESRVMYFDPNASASKGGGGGPLGVVGETVNALLYHYMRFPV
jgi:hypothetical protein